MSYLEVIPLTQKRAKAYVDEKHRHHKAPVGSILNVGVRDAEGKVRGVGMAGRPVSRHLAKDGLTLEVTRVCTDGVKNGCSMIYGALRRAAKALGYKKIITYTLESEPGISLKAAGWTPEIVTGGGSWSSPSRPRVDKHPTCPKVRWSVDL